VALACDGIFTGVSFFRGAHWRLTGEEKMALGTHLNNLALALLPEEYLGAYNGILEKFGPLCGAVVPIATIIGKRLAIDRYISAQKGTGEADRATREGNASADRPDQSGGFTPPADERVNGRTDTWNGDNFAW
jgi:hypothetical protein